MVHASLGAASAAGLASAAGGTASVGSAAAYLAGASSSLGFVVADAEATPSSFDHDVAAESSSLSFAANGYYWNVASAAAAVVLLLLQFPMMVPVGAHRPAVQQSAVD